MVTAVTAIMAAAAKVLLTQHKGTRGLRQAGRSFRVLFVFG